MSPLMPPSTLQHDEALFQELLRGVQRPLRYIGGEWNQVVKDHRDVDVTFALALSGRLRDRYVPPGLPYSLLVAQRP